MTTLKKIVIETNYIGKLAGNYFLQLDLPPRNSISVEQIAAMNFEFETADKSFENVICKMVGVVMIDLKFPIPEILTLFSHGMDEKEFIEFMWHKYPVSMPDTLQLAAYYYKKK